MEPKVLQVGEFLNVVNETLRMIPAKEMLIEGEVSDFRIAQKKWISFDLKDEKEQAVLKCFMTTWQLKVPIEDGMKVQITGYTKIYERFGTFKMNVQTVQPVGEGALRQAYELLKKKLHLEGLYETARKRPLPRFPKRVGIVTSRDAAAFTDFIRIMNNRWGGIEILHTHVHVQGQHAVREIVEAFQTLNALPEETRPDVIVLTRGGGGLEDLHAFNSEEVARAVFGSAVPVVCGVGHERDASLCDYVADVRASTPSNAAELVVPNREEVLYEITSMTRHVEQRLTDRLAERFQMIDKAARIFEFAIDRENERFRAVTLRFQEKFANWIPSLQDRLRSVERLLKSVDPTRVLARGYSIVKVSGKVVTDATSLESGVEVAIQLANGTVDAEVLRINGTGNQKRV